MESLLSSLRVNQALSQLVGESPVFLRAIRDLPTIARDDATVLIAGETGTGKELVARAIHYLSPRAHAPFVAVNCGSLTDLLFEEELFGHERGAFTDAHAQRRGLVVEAHGGTLFLDEIDALAPKGQVSILRLLQDKSFRAIGCRTEEFADIRILAATNASLESLVHTGSFRSDLFYRLLVFSIYLPPLRERKEDILPLAEYFLKKHLGSNDQVELSLEARSALLALDWPGNVRELENAITRGIHLCRSGLITVENLGIPFVVPDVSLAGATAHSFKQAKQEAISAFERKYLERIMQECHGNVSRAARRAGKERRDFGKLLKKHRLDPKCFHWQDRLAG
jgi:two-component system, NtrC family, response regulator GlrR